MKDKTWKVLETDDVYPCHKTIAFLKGKKEKKERVIL